MATLNVLLVGASSAISEATARQLAGDGARFFLLGRSAERLRAIKSDLEIRGAGASGYANLEFNRLDEHGGTFARACQFLGKIDVVMLCYGTLSNQQECQNSSELLATEIQTNFVSAVSWLHLAANYFEQRKRGTIVAVTSVAGDRGRQSNYVYGSAKAGLTVFLQGLRHRLHRNGVGVVNVKPGFVDTPMTAHLPKGLLWAKPDKIARGIVGAIRRRHSREIYLPGFWAWIMRVIRWIPEPIFARTRL